VGTSLSFFTVVKLACKLLTISDLFQAVVGFDLIGIYMYVHATYIGSEFVGGELDPILRS
jgi:hypothetical protein